MGLCVRDIHAVWLTCFYWLCFACCGSNIIKQWLTLEDLHTIDAVGVCGWLFGVASVSLSLFLALPNPLPHPHPSCLIEARTISRIHCQVIRVLVARVGRSAERSQVEVTAQESQLRPPAMSQYAINIYINLALPHYSNSTAGRW